MTQPLPSFARLRRFGRDDRGSITVEGMLMLPILVWCYLAVFVFFDAYRAQSTNIKAAYTIGDMLSRETGFVTPNYMTAMSDLQLFLTDTDQSVDLRVTVFHYDEDDDTYRLRWSEGRGGPSDLDEANLNALRDRLPVMADADIGILTETWVDYAPSYEVGIASFTFEDKVVTRPRFAPQLCWNTDEAGAIATAVC